MSYLGRLVTFLISASLALASSQQMSLSNGAAAGGTGSTLIRSGCANLGSAGGTTGNLDFSSANFIVGEVSYNGGATISVITDNQSNGNATVVTGTPLVSGDTTKMTGFYWTNPIVSATHTLTVTGTSAFIRLCYEAWSNMATSTVLDKSAVDNGGGSANVATPVLSGVGSGVRVIIVGCSADDGTFTINNSVNPDAQSPLTGGQAYAGMIGSKIQAVGADISPAVTNTGNFPACWAGAFKGN